MPSYNRVVLSGTLATGAEQWSTSFAIADVDGNNVSDPTALTTWAQSVATDFSTLLGASLKQGLALTGSIRECRIYFYPDLNSPATAVGVGTNTVAGVGTASHPLATAVVASLQTGLAGRRYRGRMYWPATAWSVGTDGTFNSTYPNTFAVEIAELMEGVCSRSPETEDPVPVVASQVGGVLTPVSAVSNDKRPDTQRSRQDNISTVRTTTPYPAP